MFFYENDQKKRRECFFFLDSECSIALVYFLTKKKIVGGNASHRSLYRQLEQI